MVGVQSSEPPGIRPSDHPTLRPSDHPTIRPSGLAYFEPDLELRKLVAHFIEERLEKQLRAGKGRLQEIKKAVPAGQSGSGKELAGRIKALQNWHEKGRALVPVMKTFLKLT